MAAKSTKAGKRGQSVKDLGQLCAEAWNNGDWNGVDERLENMIADKVDAVLAKRMHRSIARVGEDQILELPAVSEERIHVSPWMISSHKSPRRDEVLVYGSFYPGRATKDDCRVLTGSEAPPDESIVQAIADGCLPDDAKESSDEEDEVDRAKCPHPDGSHPIIASCFAMEYYCARESYRAKHPRWAGHLSKYVFGNEIMTDTHGQPLKDGYTYCCPHGRLMAAWSKTLTFIGDAHDLVSAVDLPHMCDGLVPKVVELPVITMSRDPTAKTTLHLLTLSEFIKSGREGMKAQASYLRCPACCRRGACGETQRLKTNARSMQEYSVAEMVRPVASVADAYRTGARSLIVNDIYIDHVLAQSGKRLDSIHV